MFKALCYSVVSFVSYDIVVRCYRPNLLGKLLGLTNKWTVAQQSGNYGGGLWLLNEVVSGSDEVEIDFNKPVTAVNAQVSMTYTMTWKQEVEESLSLPEYQVFGSKCYLSPLGTTRQETDKGDLNKTLEMPALNA